MVGMATHRCGIAGRGEIGGFEVGEYRLEGGFSAPDHAHAWPALAIGLLGSMQLRFDRAGCELREGAVAVIPGGDRHSERMVEGEACCLLEIPSAPRLASIATGGRSGLFERRQAMQDPGLLPIVERLVREWRTAVVGAALAMEAALLDILVALSRRPGPPTHSHSVRRARIAWSFAARRAGTRAAVNAAKLRRAMVTSNPVIVTAVGSDMWGSLTLTSALKHTRHDGTVPSREEEGLGRAR